MRITWSRYEIKNEIDGRLMCHWGDQCEIETEIETLIEIEKISTSSCRLQAETPLSLCVPRYLKSIWNIFETNPILVLSHPNDLNNSLLASCVTSSSRYRTAIVTPVISLDGLGNCLRNASVPLYDQLR